MADNEAIVAKIDSLTNSVEAHREGSREFQTEVMNILKGSFEGGKWVPGMAPLLKEQAGRIDLLELNEKKLETQRVTWKHGVGFSLVGALISQVAALIHPIK